MITTYIIISGYPHLSRLSVNFKMFLIRLLPSILKRILKKKIPVGFQISSPFTGGTSNKNMPS